MCFSPYQLSLVYLIGAYAAYRHPTFSSDASLRTLLAWPSSCRYHSGDATRSRERERERERKEKKGARRGSWGRLLVFIANTSLLFLLALPSEAFWLVLVHAGITVVTQHAAEREREKTEEKEREKQRNSEGRGCWFPCGAHEWVGGVGFHTVRMISSKNHRSVRLCWDKLGLRDGQVPRVGREMTEESRCCDL